MLQERVPESCNWAEADLPQPDREGLPPVPLPREVQRRITKAAGRDSTVLITGESGTGKEVVANEIHHRSRRRRGPFIVVDCTALPHSLFESLVFGHTTGAFTGAERARCGYFRAADGGTLFLDEIGELSLSSQAKLLRFIQDKRVVPLGMHTGVAVDVRVVAATHRDLWSLVRQKRYREDLYYRLHVVTVHLPPLRDRGEDVVRLANHFLAKTANQERAAAKPLRPDAVAALRAHTWPGNIRELENAIEYAVAMSDDLTISALDLPETVRQNRGTAAQTHHGCTLAEIERSAVADALCVTGWHKARAARRLGINRQTLYRLIKRHSLKAST